MSGNCKNVQACAFVDMSMFLAFISPFSAMYPNTAASPVDAVPQYTSCPGLNPAGNVAITFSDVIAIPEEAIFTCTMLVTGSLM